MKYKFTDETKVVDAVVLHRIECVTAFGDVECGDKGGWIESEKNLSQDGNAWVNDNAVVRDNAKVSGYAIASGYAVVRDNAVVFGNTKVGDNAVVSGNATVSGNARVRDNAKVGDNAVVRDNAVVSGYAIANGNAVVRDNAKVNDNAVVFGNTKVGDNADYIVFKNWWSSGRYFTWTRSNNKWKVGCFYGTGDELVAKAYKDSEKSGREYERVVKYVNDILKEEDNDNGNINKCESRPLRDTLQHE